MFFPYRSQIDFQGPEVESEEVLLSTKVFQVVRRVYRGGMERVFVRHRGAVTVVATTPEDKVLLIRQFRAPLGEWLWEIPAGTLEEGEDPLLCAQRELEEETGFFSTDWSYLFSVCLAPGYSSEVIHFFRARNVHPAENRIHLGDEDEVIYYLEATRDEVLSLLGRGMIKDAKTIIGLQHWLGEA
ncbi:NUDIX hydrolase [Candidatus Caldatribacterium sp.]|uniref:NUDIX hydrolase n=1 Tax=Candidatus Caldatribacterium sp. TaxID=2282143 RepID=UPI0029943F6F|nr:NUDIX hydrolase [Candidatus Caldatribacterium sp.]MDW8080769.1 NUDIX hydrolase [Candidatus Calescibacterium sp.]